VRHEVILSAEAERDIDDIVQYIAENDGVAHAERVPAGIERACSGLADMPDRGNRPKELASVGIREYREVHFKPYRVIYQVMAKRVVIHCVLDGRRDMQSQLQRRLLR
jgi:toxin ParE1/3/4